MNSVPENISFVSRAQNEEPERGQNGVIKSALRVFEIFEFFAERRRSASVAEVVKALGYPQSSTSMLLKTLTELRYLDYDRHKRQYIPTLRIALLGSWIHDQIFSETSLANLVQELHAATGATIILGMQNGIHIQYIHLVQASSKHLDWYIKPGSLRPLCRSAVGRVLLSQKTDVDVIYLLRRINAEETNPKKRLSESDFLSELDMVRQQGYAYTEGTVNSRAGVVAMQLPTPANQPHMGIGIGADIAQLRSRRKEFVALLDKTILPYRSAMTSSLPQFSSTSNRNGSQYNDY